MPKSRIVDRMVFSAAGLTAGLDSALKVNQHGVREAKFPDTAGDLGHLGLRMRPRVARVGDQSADFPPFDSDLSRARARAGVAGVEVLTCCSASEWRSRSITSWPGEPVGPTCCSQP